MPTIQEVIERRRILEEAKKGMRTERIQQIRQEPRRIVRKIEKVTQAIATPVRKAFVPVTAKPGKIVQSAFLKMFAGVQPKATKGTKGVGRPKGVYRNPANVPAQVWYKIQRQQKRLAQIKAEQISQMRQRAFAQRGIPPQAIQQMEQQRQIQQVQPTQPVNPQIPIQYPRQAQPIQPTQLPPRPSIWNRQGFQDTEVDAMGNRRIITRMTPESFWN